MKPVEKDFCLDMNCSGCGEALSLYTIGGYRDFCDKCVKAMPEFPKDKLGHFIKGKYPDFKWSIGEEI